MLTCGPTCDVQEEEEEGMSGSDVESGSDDDGGDDEEGGQEGGSSEEYGAGDGDADVKYAEEMEG